jgi:hypothetical protein
MRTGCSLPAMVGAVGLKSVNQLDGVHTAGPGTVGGRWIPDLSVVITFVFIRFSFVSS